MNRSTKNDVRKLKQRLTRAGTLLEVEKVTVRFVDGGVKEYDGATAIEAVLEGDVAEVIGDGDMAGLCRALM